MKKREKTSLEQVENTEDQDDYRFQEYADLESLPSRRAKAGKKKGLLQQLLKKRSEEQEDATHESIDRFPLEEDQEYTAIYTRGIASGKEQRYTAQQDQEYASVSQADHPSNSSNSNGWTGWTDLSSPKHADLYEPAEQEYAASWQVEQAKPVEQTWPDEEGEEEAESPESPEDEKTKQKRGFGKKVFSFLGFNVMLIALFLILMAPIVLGYLWAFRDHSLWTLDYFHSLENHPLYFQRTMEFSGLFALVYSIAMIAFIFKIKKLRKQLFFVTLIGSFLFSLYVWKYLLADNIVNYWSF